MIWNLGLCWNPILFIFEPTSFYGNCISNWSKTKNSVDIRIHKVLCMEFALKNIPIFFYIESQSSKNQSKIVPSSDIWDKIYIYFPFVWINLFFFWFFLKNVFVQPFRMGNTLKIHPWDISEKNSEYISGPRTISNHYSTKTIQINNITIMQLEFWNPQTMSNILKTKSSCEFPILNKSEWETHCHLEGLQNIFFMENFAQKWQNLIFFTWNFRFSRTQTNYFRFHFWKQDGTMSIQNFEAIW